MKSIQLYLLLLIITQNITCAEPNSQAGWNSLPMEIKEIILADSSSAIPKLALADKASGILILDKALKTEDPITMASFGCDTQAIFFAHLKKHYPSFWTTLQSQPGRTLPEIKDEFRLTITKKDLFQPTIAVFKEICTEIPQALRQKACISFLRAVSDLAIVNSEPHPLSFIEKNRQGMINKRIVTCLEYQEAVLELIKDKNYPALSEMTGRKWPLFTNDSDIHSYIKFRNKLDKTSTNEPDHVRLLEKQRDESASKEEKTKIKTILDQSFILERGPIVVNRLWELCSPKNQKNLYRAGSTIESVFESIISKISQAFKSSSEKSKRG